MHAHSGVPPERVNPARLADPMQVARWMATAIQRQRSQAMGPANRLLRWLATHFEAPLAALLAARARRGG